MSDIKATMTDAFQNKFGTAAEVVTRAPGRLEILGNHTDYNEGVVLSVAVDREIHVAAAKCEGRICTIWDMKLDSERSFDLDNLQDKTVGDWVNYIKGVVVEFNKKGVDIPAFNAVMTSTVPLSAGMSSSAALEIGVAFALGKLANADLEWVEYAKIGQGSENNYVGAQTGLLDQFSSIRGKKDCLVLSDFRSLEVLNVAIPEGTALVVANSMVKHNLTNEYNERRESCEDAVAYLQGHDVKIEALRDVSRKELKSTKDGMNVTSYSRALHVVGENERVFAGICALEKHDLKAFGALMFESHESSRINFENSWPELDTLVEIGKTLPGALGARLSGGGFGGISVHLVESDAADKYCQLLTEAYKTRTGLESEVLICTAADGAEIL